MVASFTEPAPDRILRQHHLEAPFRTSTLIMIPACLSARCPLPLVALVGCFAISSVPRLHAQPYYVSPSGSDSNAGTVSRPFATLQRAQQAVHRAPGTVYLRGGTFYLNRPLVFTDTDSGTATNPSIWTAYPGETPVISGGIRLRDLHWKAGTNGIWSTKVPADLATEEIFINGERQHLARYPNFNPTAQYFDGFAADAISTNRSTRWANPAGGYYHAMHPALWGDFTWRITGKDASGKVTLEGGWQNNRGAAAHKEYRFVENIREELDAPGEWFLDHSAHVLHFIPPAGVDLRRAVIEATLLPNLVEFRGTSAHPVRFLTLRGLTFRHAARTVMDTREPLMRSDWAIYRGGAILLEGTEDCVIEDAFLDQVGGNAIFVNRYNRRDTFRRLHIARAGASGVCFVGDPAAARSPLFNYDRVQSLDAIDRTPGPKSNGYPADCLVDDSLIYLTGRVEKQTTGVLIQLAQSITVRRCSIYDMPRAGINIGDGAWGGHMIEFCDIFDTVKETGDHGSFNSWGRDRFWRPNVSEVNAWVSQVPGLPFLDAVKPVVLRNNRWRCDHGWDIDLDDGSTNFVLTNNLCLHGGIKNREGYRRVVENNIMVDSGFHPHVWYANSGDVFRHNIVWTEYQPAIMPPPPWGQDLRGNLVHRAGAAPSPATKLQSQSGRDNDSLVADALFVNAALGNYRVREGSPALRLGFVNFDMNHFGVQDPRLHALARTPALPAAPTRREATPSHVATLQDWFGAKVRDVLDASEQSALGLPAVSGVLVVEVPAKSRAARGGLRKNDVILAFGSTTTANAETLLHEPIIAMMNPTLHLRVWRNQQELKLAFKP